MSNLDRAVAIAAEAHAGQEDKAGAPYLLHPLRVMLRMNSDEERIVAVLHDVVEDSDWNLDRLREAGFSRTVVDAVDALTRRDGETYDDFILRAAQNPIGRVVKLADLQDNSDLGRIEHPTAADLARVEKYSRAVQRLNEL